MWPISPDVDLITKYGLYGIFHRGRCCWITIQLTIEVRGNLMYVLLTAHIQCTLLFRSPMDDNHLLLHAPEIHLSTYHLKFLCDLNKTRDEEEKRNFEAPKRPVIVRLHVHFNALFFYKNPAWYIILFSFS